MAADPGATLGLVDVARRLGVDPFEVVRLMVVGGVASTTLRFSPDDVARLASLTGIEADWALVSPPSDTNPMRARVRGVLGRLLQSGRVGSATTRRDNLWRGLPDAEAAVVMHAVAVLVGEGHLWVDAATSVDRVSANPKAVVELQRIVDGKSEPPSLTAVWKR
jgi:hypothetical protein